MVRRDVRISSVVRRMRSNGRRIRLGLLIVAMLGLVVWSQIVRVPSFKSLSATTCKAQVVKRVSGGSIGNWVGVYGSKGYVLAAWNGCSGTASGTDLKSLPPGVQFNVYFKSGGRYTWANPTTDPRALEAPSTKARQAAAWFAATRFVITLRFHHAFVGTLSLYAVDWNSAGRKETIKVSNGQTTETSYLKAFAKGTWLTYPIRVMASSRATIVVINDSPGLTAQLSGLFIG